MLFLKPSLSSFFRIPKYFMCLAALFIHGVFFNIALADQGGISEEQIIRLVSEHCGYEHKDKFIKKMLELKEQDIEEQRHIYARPTSDILVDIYHNLAKKDIIKYILILKSYMKKHISYPQISYSAKSSYSKGINLFWLENNQIQFGLSGKNCYLGPYH